jgi:predicted regulator of Ras-like GTPase activity (Roadblock/LC7/MglB family)
VSTQARMGSDVDLAGFLSSLRDSRPGIRSVFLTNSQGRSLASSQLTGVERVQLSGSSAASLAIASKVVNDLQLGTLTQIQVTADRGSVLLLNVGTKAVLTLLVDADAALDLVLSDARRAADRLRGIV